MKKTALLVGGVAAAAAAVYGFLRRKEKHTAEPNDEDIDGGVVRHTSKAVPKEIKPNLIIHFSCTISTLDLIDEGDVSGKVYSLEAVLRDGAVRGVYKWHDRFGNGEDYQFRASVRFMRDVYSVLSEFDFAAHNGESYTVSGLPDTYGDTLTVVFASGERVYFSDNQNGIIPLEVTKKLVELFEKQTGFLDNRTDSMWYRMNISRSHPEWNKCFNFSVTSDDSGAMCVSGFCIDRNGREYCIEDELKLSDTSAKKLREMKLDMLPRKRRNIFRFNAADETTRKLCLTYPDGDEKEKEISNDVLEEIFEILLREFIYHTDNDKRE